MNSDTKLKNLVWYIKRGWPLFPCGSNKKPLTEHGFYDATLAIEQIQAWHEKYPNANWGMPTGPANEGGAGLVVIDIDNHEDKGINGFLAWNQIRKEHSDPIHTVTVRTGGGGSQLYFKYPNGHIVKSGTNVLGPGVDIRAKGGYVIVPPSETVARYTFEFSPADTEISDLPEWILRHVNGSIGSGTMEQPETAQPLWTHQDDPPNLVIANSALNALKQERADDYQSWVEVGMSLFSLDQEGLIAWDNWSKQSGKYKKGACAQKWKTFNKDLTDASQINFGSLIHWAEEDGMQPFIKRARKGATPEDYVNVLEAFGYSFTMNDMNDMIYFNGTRMSDVLISVIEYQLRTYGYKSEKDTQIAINKTAHDKLFHPLKDYLNGLVLEGHYDGEEMVGVDHIARLCTFFKDRDGIFPTLLKKWLVGAVGRILGPHAGQQHPMLVLDGPQGIGKSRFVWWLGSPLPAFCIQNNINTADKDFLILLCSKWIWEVEELGATLRKSDIESLKAFLSKEIVNVRKPYGRDEITKPATASFIGTINNSGGFLADSTGSRRFRVCTLTSVDWGYETAIDVNQVWAQAVVMYKAGERWELNIEEQKKIAAINSRYDVDDPLLFDLVDTFNIEPLEVGKFIATAQIMWKLRNDGKIGVGSDQKIAQRIANILIKLGCESGRERVNGQQVRVWRGVWAR